MAGKSVTAQKMKFFIKDFFGECDQICSKLQIWSHLLKKLIMENFIFCAVGNVVPVHKKVNKQNVNNYRFASLLSICSKVFEKLVLDAIFEFLIENNPKQYPVRF